MEYLEAMKGRRSIRKFTEQKVSRETLEKIVEAARFAPTWKNSQTARYVAVEDRALIDRIADEATMGREHNRGIIRSCQTLIVLTSVKGICGYEPDGSFSTNKGNEWQMFDAGIAAEAFTTTAYNFGVASVIMGIFSDEKVGELIGLDDSRVVSALIAIGYADQPPREPVRKDVSEYLTFIP